MNGDEKFRETLDREKRLTDAFSANNGRPPRMNDLIEAEGRRWQYGDGIGWWALPTWFGSSGALLSPSAMNDPERLQKIVNEIGPARWQEIDANHFRVEFFSYADGQDEATKEIVQKAHLVEEKLADLGAKVRDLSPASPAVPPRQPPKDIVAYEGE
jgi:hypothetical protein